MIATTQAVVAIFFYVFGRTVVCWIPYRKKAAFAEDG